MLFECSFIGIFISRKDVLMCPACRTSAVQMYTRLCSTHDCAVHTTVQYTRLCSTHDCTQDSSCTLSSYDSYFDTVIIAMIIITQR